MDMEASLGVMQIAPSGNLNRGEKHCLTNVIPNDTTFIDFAVNIYSGAVPSAVYITVLWREPDVNLNFGIGVPGGLNILLNGNGSWQTVPPYSFYSYRSTSQRGTAEYDITIYDTDLTGDWILFIDNNYSATSEINGYIADDVSAWEGGAEFTEFLSNMKTCTWPSTADSAFVLGSYSTRGYEQYIGVGSGSIQPGQLSKFSGRGPRIDGVHILSLISPGNYDVYTTRAPFDPPYTFGGWRQFSGTSAAGPHVAGSAALLKQGLLDASQFEIGWILSQNTFRDQFTGSDYNDSCGYGKVRVYDALYSTGVIDLPEVEMPRSFSVEVHPNPFNPEAEIEFYLPISGITKAKIYDLLGREVAVLSNHWLPAGDHYMTWNANGFASGVYFLQIKSGKYSSVKKLLVLK
jgi:subtilisin family serine protease